MEITTTSLTHLGLVAGIFDKLGIADIIIPPYQKIGITTYLTRP